MREHEPRIERAIAFILEHIEEPLTLAEVARAAYVSPYHFHRLFSAATREPVGRFITRKRLQLAALRLAYEPDRDVTDIALSSGYSSPSNFTKAFSAYFGCSPSHVRVASAGETSARPVLALRETPLVRARGARSALTLREPTERPVAVTGRLVATPEVALCCVAASGLDEYESVRDGWLRLVAALRPLGLCRDAAEGFGILFDHRLLTPPALRRYHAGVRCPDGFDPPAPLFRSRIDAGQYMVFALAGEASEIRAQFASIYGRWPLDGPLVPENRMPIMHWERPPAPDRLGFSLWVKVRPRR